MPWAGPAPDSLNFILKINDLFPGNSPLTSPSQTVQNSKKLLTSGFHSLDADREIMSQTGPCYKLGGNTGLLVGKKEGI